MHATAISLTSLYESETFSLNDWKIENSGKHGCENMTLKAAIF